MLFPASLCKNGNDVKQFLYLIWTFRGYLLWYKTKNWEKEVSYLSSANSSKSSSWQNFEENSNFLHKKKFGAIDLSWFMHKTGKIGYTIIC